MATDSKWFLDFSSKRYNWPEFKDTGCPWGEGTSIAGREAFRLDPWDENCKVTTLIGGYESMKSMRSDLEKLVIEAKKKSNTDPKVFFADKNNKIGDLGYVYICGWRLNSLRDFSEPDEKENDKDVTNDWVKQDRPWTKSDKAQKDWTSLGIILRLMQAGIHVRILLWLPHHNFSVQSELLAGFKPHTMDHFFLANYVQKENIRLMNEFGLNEPIGIVGLDCRVASNNKHASTHHQKMIVIRGIETCAAYCGGVDWAYTRRDSPSKHIQYNQDITCFLGGDIQSNGNIPETTFWPKDSNTHYLEDIAYDEKQGSDLPAEIYEVLTERQFWHDQHLRVEGKIVETLEDQFKNRWTAEAYHFSLAEDTVNISQWGENYELQLSWRDYDSTTKFPNSEKLITTGSPGPSSVQMWRTIPVRYDKSGEEFFRGEFTAMEGIANACNKATQLIWIFDQYFWCRPLAKLLNKRLVDSPTLHLIIILPPYADGNPFLPVIGTESQVVQHYLRRLALYDLYHADSKEDVSNRIGIYNLWFKDNINPENSLGIYCHAKVQMYDQKLLVCGSCNLNRRSFTNDSELICAVQDEEVVHNHQKRLWSLLFNGIPWSDVNMNSDPKSGETFFKHLTDSIVNNPYSTNLERDPWDSNLDCPILLNKRTRNQRWTAAADLFDLDTVVADPTCFTSEFNWDSIYLDDLIKKIEDPSKCDSWRK